MEHTIQKSYYEGLKERNEESAHLSLDHALLERLNFVLIDKYELFTAVHFLLNNNSRCTVFHSKRTVCHKQ